jgi:hypothetical protein
MKRRLGHRTGVAKLGFWPKKRPMKAPQAGSDRVAVLGGMRGDPQGQIQPLGESPRPIEGADLREDGDLLGRTQEAGDGAAIVGRESPCSARSCRHRERLRDASDSVSRGEATR